MEESRDALNEISQDAEANNTRKVWKTPELRILPVPTKTQGGGGDRNDQDDIFYRRS